RRLAVDVYATQGAFPAAESVLAAGERNALDTVPVFRGVTEVLARRDSARTDGIARAVTTAPSPSSHGADQQTQEAPECARRRAHPVGGFRRLPRAGGRRALVRGVDP